MSYSQNTNIQSEINKMKAEIMLDEIIIKYNFIKDIDTEENIIKKIIELNFDENQIKKYYNEKIYYELDDDYHLTSLMEEEVIKDKIKSLNCNKELIMQWLENELVGN